MAANSKTILQKDIKIEGNLFEKEDIELDGEIKGNIRAENFETLKNSKITGNVKSNEISLDGTLEGNIESNKVHIKKNANITGTIKQKTLSVEEGAKLNIKTETSS